MRPGSDSFPILFLLPAALFFPAAGPRARRRPSHQSCCKRGGQQAARPRGGFAGSPAGREFGGGGVMEQKLRGSPDLEGWTDRQVHQENFPGHPPGRAAQAPPDGQRWPHQGRRGAAAGLGSKAASSSSLRPFWRPSFCAPYPAGPPGKRPLARRGGPRLVRSPPQRRHLWMPREAAARRREGDIPGGARGKAGEGGRRGSSSPREPRRSSPRAATSAAAPAVAPRLSPGAAPQLRAGPGQGRQRRASLLLPPFSSLAQQRPRK